MNLLKELREAVAVMPAAAAHVSLEQDLVRRLRVFLVNLNEDEEQENFFIDNLQSREKIVEIPSHLVSHLIEYLQGATS